MEIAIEAVVTAKLGLASHQNAVPLLRQLSITNQGAEDLDDLVLELAPALPFAVGKTWQVDRLGSHATINVADRDVELTEGYLSDLAESVLTAVHVRLKSRNGTVISEQRQPVELLARNQWGGASSMPELLAVFCTPNDPDVDKVLKAASDVLRRAGKRDGIDGYEQKSRQRVWELASSIWSAVCGFRISYALPPASFESEGQKVRTPSQVLEGGVGTCLDTALLFAAALEQAGLNPILILTQGHAFCGVWLQPQEFAQLLTEDASAVRKRVGLQELVVFETTLSTQSAPATFTQAVESAKRKLTDQGFIMAVDVRRARMQKLRPLGIATAHRTGTSPESEPSVSEALDPAPDLPGFDVEVEEAPATPAAKLELWRRKLLDLTTRNRLLHLPQRSKAIWLACPDPGRLEDILADHKTVRVVAMPDTEVGGRDGEIYNARSGENLEDALARQAMARGEVMSKMDKGKLDSALVDLYRKARTDLEEGGSNTLFLAIGFLRWKKTKDDPSSYYAPLILLPVKLERQSVRSSVKMSMLDDEPRFNQTLLELLRHDFQLNIAGLDGELPTDQSGIDVDGILRMVQRGVRDVPGFEVVRDVVLSTFSFAKYLMWRDLSDRSDQLMQNDVVRHLLLYKFGASAFESRGDFPGPAELDAKVEPGELFTPLPVDSSQLAAIVASAKGQSFVLDGPPGTGKSQTIANMIAHNLALGRRVLFVAEKMAALDVVKRRLDAKGIGEFCVELHSSKSSKLHVLQQLDRAWMARGRLSERRWQEQADGVRALRDHLNQVVSVLHASWPNGLSVFDAMGRVLRDATPATPRLSWPESARHDPDQMKQFRDVARRLDLNRAVVDGAAEKFALLANTEWSNAWQEAIVQVSREVIAALDDCERACELVIRGAGLSLTASVATAARLLPFAQVLTDIHGIDLGFSFAPTMRAVKSAVPEAQSLLGQYRTTEQGLSQNYGAEVLRHVDVGQLQADWEAAEQKFWFLASLAKKKVAKNLSATAGIAGIPDVERDLPRLQAVQPLAAKLDVLDSTLRGVPGWAGLDSDTGRMVLAVGLADKLHAALVGLAQTPERLLELRQEARRLVVDGNDLLAPEGALALAIHRLAAAHATVMDATVRFAKLAAREIDLADDAVALRANSEAIVANEAKLNAWCSWRRVRQEAVALRLEPLVNLIEAGGLSGMSVAETFEVAYARWFAAMAIDAEPLLRDFVPAEQQSDIEAYRSAVDTLSELTSAYIRRRISADVPDKDGVTRNSGYGVLRHQLQLQRRHKPVRQLIQEMGADFAALAPCMLMSPLSIAQYLPAGHQMFDLVIFDEASQIAPWDAVGSIGRGKQVVIAGDPRQMPPTSFFDRGASGGDDDTEADLESVLDECLAAGLPRRNLSWHYRSRHESLITFSNYNYYNGGLITFPAADTRPSAVTWHRVSGLYSRGKGRHNQAEAEAIVAEVVKRLRDPAFVASKQTIGVITLNVDQQQLINDLLDKAQREYPAIEKFFKADLAEPVTVKNLETMQGDERDLIILGVGFGPTEPGANTMSMNFGPLNRDGGWRRLNVAVTRARREMLVFTSFDPWMIDLSRTRARAVADLRHFIEFAKSGPKAISDAVHGSVGGYESPFEQYVAEGLRRRNWEVRTQIGVSRFRIDLGIVHPDRPGDYLVGVECDGATYHSAATARDRDKVRADILHGLGWNLVRVWSTAWWVDPEGALDRLDQSIKKELEASRAEAAKLAKQQADTDVMPFDAVSSGASDEGGDSDGDGAGDDADSSTTETGAAGDNDGFTEPQRLIARGPDADDGSVLADGKYHKADLADFRASLDANRFYEPSYVSTLETLIQRVVEQEAPIHDKALVDRIARVHGFQRSGHRIHDRVLLIAKRCCHFQPDVDPDNGCFVWLTASDPAQCTSCRLPACDADVRFIDEIPAEEIVAAAKGIEGDVATEVARLFGVRRLSAVARRRIEACLRRG